MAIFKSLCLNSEISKFFERGFWYKITKYHTWTDFLTSQKIKGISCCFYAAKGEILFAYLEAFTTKAGAS